MPAVQVVPVSPSSDDIALEIIKLMTGGAGMND